MRLGIRELRDRLSQYLGEVREGRTITITDHGKPIARIVPVGEHSALDQLILEGQVKPARRAKRSAPTRIKASGTVSDLVGEQRG